MTTPALVSIALATFNGARYLAEQMDSLLAQDYPNLEIVVSDDGSTDATLEILHAYAAKDSRIRVLAPRERLGFNNNFARCFTACHGTLISPCDQDDVWHPRKTRALVEALGYASLAYCNSRFIDGDGLGGTDTFAAHFRMVRGSDPKHLLFFNTISGHAMLFRKDVLASSGATPAGMYYDWWLAFVCASLGAIVYLDEVLVDYRRHPAAVTVAEQASRGNTLRIQSLRANASRLARMAELPSAHQPYMRELSNAWQAWERSYVDWRMLRRVSRDASVIYHPIYDKISPLRHPAFDFVLGHRLKKLIWPHRYIEPDAA